MIIIICALITLLITIVSGIMVVPLLKRIKAGQTVLKYVENHKVKSGTPTMGGLFFIIPAVIVYFAFSGFGNRSVNVALSIGLAFLIVGFIDDFLKIYFKKNEGLKPYQKILFQVSIAIVSGIYCYVNNLTRFNLPFVGLNFDLNIFTIPIVAFIFVAITNSVNLTDGLDGLAGSVSLIYLIFCIALITIQNNDALLQSEYDGLSILSSCLIGGLAGFLVFNSNRAKVFMGDTGSLSLGGFLGAISIFSSNSFFIPFLGITFVASGISVIIQVLYFKKTKKRIFLMAPIHHHFQLKGYTEPQIAYCYSLITAVAGLLCILVYL